MGNSKTKMNALQLTIIVAVNMMGSGIFMLPATLAQVSTPVASIMAWIFTGIGAIILSLTFANLGSKIPKTGGVYEYSRIAFGDFWGFITAWLYCYYIYCCSYIFRTSYRGIDK